MIIRQIVFIFIVFYSLLSYSQVKGKINIGLESNMQYYVNDAVTGDFTEKNSIRSNNYLTINYRISNFDFGLQLESYYPQALLNYSPNFNKKIGLGTYFASYKTKKTHITLGYYYEQFGNGLVLRTWEDRQLGINNALRGARIKYNPTDNLNFTLLYGKQRVGFKVSEGSIIGFDTNLDASKNDFSLQFGFSYAGRIQNFNRDFTIEHQHNKDFNPLTSAFSGRINYAKNNIYANLEGVFKSKDNLVELGNIIGNKSFYGNAILLETGYSKKGFGFTTTMRRIENMTFYSDRQANGNTFNEQIINFIPALTRQQDYSLANIYVYNAQPKLSFNPLNKVGEIGLQWDLFYKIKKGKKLGGKYGTKIALNFSNWYGIDADYLPEFKRVNSKFLSLGERYFTDYTIEVRKKLSKKDKMIYTFINSYYNRAYVEETYDVIKSNILAIEWSHQFENKKSLRLEAQHLWTKQDKKNWAAATTEFNLNSKISFYASDMYNYGNDKSKEQNHYYNFGGSYTKNSNRFALSYGRQREGLLCIGGVCRVVSAATGFTFNANISF
ncbi:MAG TPA: hypothetical protein ENK67_04780 [Flavobacteriia bacterium]|nr:hypothetical protein [Flavobacteriia bacterium]